MPLERAEMHTRAFVQVTAVWRLVCGSARCWCSALSTSPHRCSASRFCSLPVIAQRWRFLVEALDDVRFVPGPSFRYSQVIENHSVGHRRIDAGNATIIHTPTNLNPATDS